MYLSQSIFLLRPAARQRRWSALCFWRSVLASARSPPVHRGQGGLLHTRHPWQMMFEVWIFTRICAWLKQALLGKLILYQKIWVCTQNLFFWYKIVQTQSSDFLYKSKQTNMFQEFTAANTMLGKIRTCLEDRTNCFSPEFFCRILRTDRCSQSRLPSWIKSFSWNIGS